MSERIRRPLALFVVSVLLVALSAGAALADDIFGTPGPDNIFGTPNDDRIWALGANDFVDAFSGDDEVYGGNGNDELLGAEDSDTVLGGNGIDIVDLVSFDTVGSFDQGYGGAANDTVYAKDGNFDAINCGAGTNDKVYKDPGDTQTGCESVNPASASAVAAQEDAMEKAKELRASQ